MGHPVKTPCSVWDSQERGLLEQWTASPLLRGGKEDPYVGYLHGIQRQEAAISEDERLALLGPEERRTGLVDMLIDGLLPPGRYISRVRELALGTLKALPEGEASHRLQQAVLLSQAHRVTQELAYSTETMPDKHDNRRKYVDKFARTMREAVSHLHAHGLLLSINAADWEQMGLLGRDSLLKEGKKPYWFDDGGLVGLRELDAMMNRSIAARAIAQAMPHPSGTPAKRRM